mmetsp:Transcript_88324/g.224831  ORF Transcript_88324/g.224831 Transcript_88324/m.224831 type:complete len:225 (-) Transcript_88324:74-748(-)
MLQLRPEVLLLLGHLPPQRKELCVVSPPLVREVGHLALDQRLETRELIVELGNELATAHQLLGEFGVLLLRQAQLLLQMLDLLPLCLLLSQAVPHRVEVALLGGHDALKLCDLLLVLLEDFRGLDGLLLQRADAPAVLLLHPLRKLLPNLLHLGFRHHRMIPKLLKESRPCSLQLLLEFLFHILHGFAVAHSLDLLGFELHLLSRKVLECLIYSKGELNDIRCH